MSNQPIPLGLYIHFPWCIKKCPYCDFNSHAAPSQLDESAYIAKLLLDLEADLEQFKISRSIHSIFMGGGTPSLFAPESFSQLLQGITARINIQENAEITLEANPGTFESGKFSEYRDLGINRLSIGIQSFNDQYLQRLGRVHTAWEAIRAAELAQQSGFENFNLDLMYGLPNSTLADAEQDVSTAISLEPAHISYYQLTLEPNTYFHKFPPPLPVGDEIYAIQRQGHALLAKYGYIRYEVSAFSKNSQPCAHNLNYWRFGDYVGIGAGAHGKISLDLPGKIIRYAKKRGPDQYLANSDAYQFIRTLQPSDITLEFMMNLLRLQSGFAIEAFHSRTGLSSESIQHIVNDCMQQELLEYDDMHYRCTRRGWDFLDDILEKFLPV